MQEADARTAKILKVRTRAGESFWFVAVLDATASMDYKIKGVREAVPRIARKLNAEFGEALSTNFACIEYRDPVDAPEEAHRVHPFGEVKPFVEFVKTIEAKGGGDLAEDVAGAIELLLPMLKGIPAGDTVFVAHITDAVGHGMRSGEGDRHYLSQRERIRRRFIDLASEMRRFGCCEWHFFVPGSGKHLMDIANEYRELLATSLGPDGDIDRYFKLCQYHDFAGALLNSVYNSVSHSVLAPRSHSIDPFGAPAPPTQTSQFAPYLSVLATGNDANVLKGSGVERPGYADEAKESGEADDKGSDDSDAPTKPPVPFWRDDRAVVLCGEIRYEQATFPASRFFQRELTKYAKEAPNWQGFMTNWARFQQNLYGVGGGAWRPPTLEPSVTTSAPSAQALVLHKEPLGRGRERVAFHAAILPNVTEAEMTTLVEATDSTWPDTHKAICDARTDLAISPLVVKLSALGDADLQSKMTVHTFGIWAAHFFNTTCHNKGLLKTPAVVHVLAPVTIHIDTVRAKKWEKGIFVQTKGLRGTVVGEASLAEIKAPFQKWINNDGKRAPSMDAEEREYELCYYVLDFWILAVAGWTDYALAPSDLQGKCEKHSDGQWHFYLTDLAASSENVLAFDQATNWGKHGVAVIVSRAYDNAKTHPAFSKFLAAFGLDHGALEGRVAGLRRLINASTASSSSAPFVGAAAAVSGDALEAERDEEDSTHAKRKRPETRTSSKAVRLAE